MKKLEKIDGVKKLKSNIEKIERKWKKQMKDPNSGGLDSGINRKLIQLRIALGMIT